MKCAITCKIMHGIVCCEQQSINMEAFAISNETVDNLWWHTKEFCYKCTINIYVLACCLQSINWNKNILARSVWEQWYRVGRVAGTNPHSHIILKCVCVCNPKGVFLILDMQVSKNIVSQSGRKIDLSKVSTKHINLMTLRINDILLLTIQTFKFDIRV